MAGDHATHFLVTREYADRYGVIDRPGAVLCELYVHEYVDTEAVATAKSRGAWAHAPDSVVRHRHSMCGENFPEDINDPVYLAQAERMRASWPLFRRRRRLWDPTAPRIARRPTGARRGVRR